MKPPTCATKATPPAALEGCNALQRFMPKNSRITNQAGTDRKNPQNSHSKGMGLMIVIGDLG